MFWGLLNSHVRVFQNSQIDNEIEFPNKITQNLIHRCFWFNAMESTKKSKFPIGGGLTKAMGTLICLVNFAALHQKHIHTL